MARHLLILLFLTYTSNLYSQEIDFGSFSSSYSVTLAELSPGAEIDFGTVYEDVNPFSVDINSAVVLTIEGVRYLDIIVDLDGPDYLTLNGAPCGSASCQVAFTMKASYGNRGSLSTSQVTNFNVGASNIASAQFPIRYRGNAPPGPPPTPVYQGFNPSLFNETAYLYIYGDITVGSVTAGSYSGTVNVTVSYD